MSWADALKKQAEEAGHEVIQGSVQGEEKADTKAAFAAALNKAAVPAAPVIPAEPPLIARELGAVPKWSFSALKMFENCPKSAEYRYVDGRRDEQGEAAARGELFHDGYQAYVEGVSNELPDDNRSKTDVFVKDLDELRELHKLGAVHCEQDWYFDRDWMPCEKDNRWGIAKLDAFVDQDKSCRIIDYKTGRKFGNEMKHSDQGLCYAITAYFRFPEKDFFQVEFWYIDQGDTMVRSFTRAQLAVLISRYERRALLFTTATTFSAKPNANACRFCPYTNNKSSQGVAYGDSSCPDDYYGATVV